MPLALMEYPRVLISINLSTATALGLGGCPKTPVRPFAIAVKNTSQLGGRYSFQFVSLADHTAFDSGVR